MAQHFWVSQTYDTTEQKVNHKNPIAKEFVL